MKWNQIAQQDRSKLIVLYIIAAVNIALLALSAYNLYVMQELIKLVSALVK